MKALWFLLVLAGLRGAAQTMVMVGTGSTVTLSFPAQVSYVDLGSAQIDARLVGPGSRTLLVKALQPDMAETNLTVVTAGDEVYTFKVCYSSVPYPDVIHIAGRAMPAASFAASIMDNGRRAGGMSNTEQGIYAQVRGIYVHDSLLFFHLRVSNTTALRFNVEAIRFLIMNKKGGRRTARQERSIMPLSFHGNVSGVPQDGSATCVVVLPKFTLSKSRRLVIELLERGGERNLRLKVAPHKLSGAIPLPAL